MPSGEANTQRENLIPAISAFLGACFAFGGALIPVSLSSTFRGNFIDLFGKHSSWSRLTTINSIEWFAAAIVFLIAVSFSTREDQRLLRIWFNLGKSFFWIVPVGSIIISSGAYALKRYHAGISHEGRLIGIGLLILITSIGLVTVIAMLVSGLRKFVVALAQQRLKSVAPATSQVADRDFMNSILGSRWLALSATTPVPSLRQDVVRGIDIEGFRREAGLTKYSFLDPPQGWAAWMKETATSDASTSTVFAGSHRSGKSGSGSVILRLKPGPKGKKVQCKVEGNGFVDEAERLWSHSFEIEFTWPKDFLVPSHTASKRPPKSIANVPKIPANSGRPKGNYKVTWFVDGQSVATDSFTKRNPVPVS